MFQYHSTHIECGQTPAEQICGRQIRTQLHLLKPESTDLYAYMTDA